MVEAKTELPEAAVAPALRRPELVAPAGDFACLRAALAAGADAVYYGVGNRLNMRTAARNFRLEDLPEIAAACRARGARNYLTLNTIVFQRELADCSAILERAVGRVDAVIAWDPAVLRRCRELGLPTHVSTQASVASIESARYYRGLGAVRIVPARECTLDEVLDIQREAGVEVEAFVHGAMCINFSGQCFLSQDLFNRSGNRGECLQPCRREYLIHEVEEGAEYLLGRDYVLSAKDLCTMPFIEVLIASGLDAFKIEGRNRNPEYVDTVVRCYRRALDAHRDGRLDATLKEALVAELKTVYNRTFAGGFYFGRPIAEFAHSRRNQATHRKEYVGYVTHYYRKIGVVEIQVMSNPFRPGDELIIDGPTSGVVRVKPAQVLRDGQPLAETPRAAVTLPCAERVRRGDKVYIHVLRQGRRAGE
ncbi:MAG: putative protease YhbU precursor [Lentisphaerae bacterium ADurb.BinA184]|nr:MAG: putative protease YhbU precursor [Lentisphaerae bacterium ADurb.BinA184]